MVGRIIALAAVVASASFANNSNAVSKRFDVAEVSDTVNVKLDNRSELAGLRIVAQGCDIAGVTGLTPGAERDTYVGKINPNTEAVIRFKNPSRCGDVQVDGLLLAQGPVPGDGAPAKRVAPRDDGFDHNPPAIAASEEESGPSPEDIATARRILAAAERSQPQSRRKNSDGGNGQPQPSAQSQAPSSTPGMGAFNSPFFATAGAAEPRGFTNSMNGSKNYIGSYNDDQVGNQDVNISNRYNTGSLKSRAGNYNFDFTTVQRAPYGVTSTPTFRKTSRIGVDGDESSSTSGYEQLNGSGNFTQQAGRSNSFNTRFIQNNDYNSGTIDSTGPNVRVRSKIIQK